MFVYWHKRTLAPTGGFLGTGGYKITDQTAMYFVSFAVVGWVDVFTRKEYKGIFDVAGFEMS